MRKTIIIIISAVLLLGTLSACGNEKELPQEIQETKALETEDCTGQNISEPNSIDDSYTFTVPEALDIPITKYFTENVLPEYARKWTSSGNIIDSSVTANFAGNKALIYGWVLLDGSAKAENNWRSLEVDGEQCYCRSIFAVGSGYGSQWQAKKSSYLKPAESIARTSGNLEASCEIKGLQGAELYVNQLGQSYSINDAATLRRLEKALSRPTEVFNPPSLPFSSAEFLNPLYLYFEDGSVRLVQTLGSGAPGNDCFGVGGIWGPESLFEIMGVPLEAEGYSKAEDGSVKLSLNMPATFTKDTGVTEYSFTVTALYDAEGKLISIDSPDEHRENLFQQFLYDESGRLSRINTNVNGELVNIEEFQYDSLGLLLWRVSTSPDKNSGYYREYEYDSENRLIADIFYKLDGSEGGIESNVYYWYDESGVQHIYSFNSDGSTNGVPPNDVATRK